MDWAGIAGSASVDLVPTEGRPTATVRVHLSGPTGRCLQSGVSLRRSESEPDSLRQLLPITS